MEGVIVKLKGNAGSMTGWGGEDVPIHDRFFKGGDFVPRLRAVGHRPAHGARPRAGDGKFDAIGGQTMRSAPSR